MRTVEDLSPPSGSGGLAFSLSDSMPRTWRQRSVELAALRGNSAPGTHFPSRPQVYEDAVAIRRTSSLSEIGLAVVNASRILNAFANFTIAISTQTDVSDRDREQSERVAGQAVPRHGQARIEP